jgi:hypothetical protein
VRVSIVLGVSALALAAAGCSSSKPAATATPTPTAKCDLSNSAQPVKGTSVTTFKITSTLTTPAGKTGTETFYGTTTSTANQPAIPLKATGLFTDTGSIDLKGGSGAGKGTVKLTKGSLTVGHSKDHNGPSSMNRATCVAVFSIHGTVKSVLSGTGAYKGYTGHGTFRVTFGGTMPRVK